MPKSIIYIVILVPLVFSLVIVNSAQASQRSATQTVTGTGRTCAAAERDARSKLKSGRDICTDACVPKGLFCEYGCSRVSPVGMPNDVGTCTQNDDGSFMAKIDRAMLCNYTCRSSSSGRAPSAQPQQPQAAETTQPNLLQRFGNLLRGGGQNNNVVKVDLTPTTQEDDLVSSITLPAAEAIKNPLTAVNNSKKPVIMTVKAVDPITGQQYAGQAEIPPNSRYGVQAKNIPKNSVVTYTITDGQAGFVPINNQVETYEKLLKGLFGDNNGTTMEIKTPKKGLQFTYSITSQDPNEPLNVTFDGKKQKVREIKESILVDTLTTNYNLTFDGLSVLRGGDEVAKVLALLFSGGASLLVQWIPAPEKSQEPTTGGTSGGGTSGGEPPTGGVPPRGRCRPSELGGSDLERTWRQRGHDLISSCSWVNSGHDLEGSFNTETWGPGHNFGQSKLSAPDGWSPVD